MENKQEPKKESKVIYFIMYCCLIVIMVGSIYISLNYGDNIKTYSHLQYEVDLITTENLSFPFPSTREDPLYNFDYYDYRRYVFERDIFDFHNYLNSKYEYVEGTYDCKYWTLVWGEYYAYNKNSENNWKFKTITTDNHIFGMIYNESGYCITDLYYLDCTDGMY